MAILDTALDPRAPSFLENRSTALAALTALEAAHSQARDGGGEREVTRHHARGKLLPRERIELLVDRDTALLELSATAGTPAGAGVVTALGIVEQVQCVIVGNDPTIRESGLSGTGRGKAARAVELAQRYQLPMIFLWESTAEAREVIAHGNVPVLTCVFGNCDGPPPLSDHAVLIRGHGDLANADEVADDERDALRLMRHAVRRLCKPVVSRVDPGVAPKHETDDLLAVHRSDLREVLARIFDGSELDEMRPHRGSAMIAGFGAVHGHRVAVMGNCDSLVDAESVHKGIELVRQSTLAGLPLIVLATATAGPAGGGLLAQALAETAQVTVLLEAAAPDWALVSKGFRFTWPGAGDESYDGVIDPRDTRTVLGICLSALGGGS